MTEKEAIECLDNIFTEMLIEKTVGKEEAEAVKVLVEALKKKELVIDEMTKQIEVIRENSEEDCFIPKELMPINACVKTECKECIKRYFERKVEENLC